ncbi:MAG: hypothetical protein HY694_03970 [Deltaproteobacteria bacterium]|nr:hypothetical protein [Deltaproteobacteria bacterium]
MKKFIWPFILLLILVLSAGLISYAWWLFQIEKGHRTFRRGDNQTASEIYQAAEAPFRTVPWLAQLLRDDYQRLAFSQVGLLYAEGRNDEVIEKLQEEVVRAPFLLESGEYSFWLGNALLRRAVQSKDPEASMDALKAAGAEYQKGLVAQPEDWDLKYNYELVKHILSQKERDTKQQEEKVKSILEKMRPTVDPSREKLPPEKQG